MLKCTVLTTPGEVLDALRDTCTWADEVSFAYAWITGAAQNAEHWRYLPLEKVKHAVVGVHFLQTEPQALRILARLGTLRIIPETGGLFHPKVLIARHRQSVRALIGSSNFTVGGFSGNVEVNVLLQGSVDDSELIKLHSFVEQQWSHSLANTPDKAWLDHYQAKHAKRPKPPRISRPGHRPKLKPAAMVLNLEWDGFFQLIREQHRRADREGWHISLGRDSILGEAEACRRAFSRGSRFEDLSEEDRKLIAGWGPSSGYFGNMRGAGRFKNLTIADAKRIGAALDPLPSEGAVTIDQAKRCLQTLMKLSGVGLGAATRLMTAKRPDCFLPANTASVRLVRKHLGIRPTDAEQYVSVIEQVWSSVVQCAHATRRRASTALARPSSTPGRAFL